MFGWPRKKEGESNDNKSEGDLRRDIANTDEEMQELEEQNNQVTEKRKEWENSGWWGNRNKEKNLFKDGGSED